MPAILGQGHPIQAGFLQLGHLPPHMVPDLKKPLDHFPGEETKAQ